MLRFLTEKEIAGAVKALLNDADRACLAVAFWGKGAVKTLGINPGMNRRLRVICNLTSGACNPDEVKALMSRAQVRMHPRLHAKIYWTPTGAIVGSSNASSNGLVVEGAALKGWLEGNLQTDDDSVLDDIGRQFEAMWKEAASITQTDLSMAKARWNERNKLSPPAQELSRETLLAAYRKVPRDPRWNKVKLVIYRYGLDALGRDTLHAFKQQPERAGEVVDASRIQRAWGYQGWEGEFDDEDWIIDVNARNLGKPRIEGYAEIGSRLIRIWQTDGQVLHVAFRSPRILLPGLGAFQMSAKEKAEICNQAHGFLMRDGKDSFPYGRALCLPDAMDMIGS